MTKPIFVMISVLMTAIFASGCSVSPQAATHPLPSDTHVRTSIAMPTLTFPSPTETPTLEPSALQIDYECAQELKAGTQYPRSDGVLLLQDSRKALIFLLDVKSGKLTQLPKDYYNMLNLTASPNGEWFAYDTSTFNNSDNEIQIVVAKPDGTVYKKISSDSNQDIDSWLTNDMLQIGVILKQGDDPRFATLFLNPFTGDHKQLVDDYPNIKTSPPRYLFPTYAPDLTKVFYQDDHLNLVLYDLGSKKVLSKIPDAAPRGLMIDAEWSPDGSYIVAVRRGTPPFLLISQDGQRVNEWTKAADMKDLILNSYSWSPDSSRIAFWMNIASSVGKNDTYHATTEMMIFDVAGKKGANHCLTGIENFDLVPAQYWAAPVWSPDGSQIAFMRLKQEDEKQYDIVVLDLKTNTYWKITENMELIGWLKNQ